MSNGSKSLANKGGAKNPPVFGVKKPGSVANKCPANAGKGVIGKSAPKTKKA